MTKMLHTKIYIRGKTKPPSQGDVQSYIVSTFRGSYLNLTQVTIFSKLLVYYNSNHIQSCLEGFLSPSFPREPLCENLDLYCSIRACQAYLLRLSLLILYSFYDDNNADEYDVSGKIEGDTLFMTTTLGPEHWPIVEFALDNVQSSRTLTESFCNQ